MSQHNQSNRGGGSIKELFASYLYGLREELEEALAEAAKQHQREFVTKAELKEAIAELKMADGEQTQVLLDFIQRVANRFDRRE
jgi:hypothetical protein